MKFTERTELAGRAGGRLAPLVEAGQPLQLLAVVHAQGIGLPPQTLVTVHLSRILHICFFAAFLSSSYFGY